MFGLRRATWVLIGRSLNQLRSPSKSDLSSRLLISSSKTKSIANRSQSPGCRTMMEKPHLKYGILSIQTRSFRKTNPRNVLPPIVLIMISKIGKFGAILVGRKIRRMPMEQKALYFEKAKKNRYHFYALFTVLGVAGVVYYFEHLEEAPITKRKRFLAFSEEEVDILADGMLQVLLELNRDKLVPATDPRHQRVFRIAQSLADANRNLLDKVGKNKRWTVSLVDEPVENAFVLSTGSIFVYSGLLDLCDDEGPSDSSVAIILAHELAHVVMNHVREQASVFYILDVVLIIPLLILWSLMPSDVTAAFLQWLLGKVSEVLFSLPYSRHLETEADEVGLILAARACFDVREGLLIWKKMEMRNKQAGVPEVDMLSTHPTNESRHQSLSRKLGAALAVREESGCPQLPFMDVAKRLSDYDNRLRNQHRTALIAKPIQW